jgi:hypothetical protein
MCKTTNIFPALGWMADDKNQHSISHFVANILLTYQIGVHILFS